MSAVDLLRDVTRVIDLEVTWAKSNRGLPVVYGRYLLAIRDTIAAALELLAPAPATGLPVLDFSLVEG